MSCAIKFPLDCIDIYDMLLAIIFYLHLTIFYILRRQMNQQKDETY